MVKKLLLGGILGGIVLFVWLGISWTATGLHMRAMHAIPEADGVLAELSARPMEHGVYYYPSHPETDDRAAWEAMTEQARQGPVIPFMVYLPQGYNPMDPLVMARGLMLSLLAALIVTFVTLAARQTSYKARVAVATCFGAVVALAGPMTFGNFFFFPLDFILPEILDQLLGWTLAGLVIAWATRPDRPREAAPAAAI